MPLTYGWYWKTWWGWLPQLEPKHVPLLPSRRVGQPEIDCIRTEGSRGRTWLTEGRTRGQLAQALCRGASLCKGRKRATIRAQPGTCCPQGSLSGQDGTGWRGAEGRGDPSKTSTLFLCHRGHWQDRGVHQELTPPEGDTASIPSVGPSRASLPAGAQQEMGLALGDSSKGPKAEAEKLAPGCQMTTEQPCGSVHQDQSPQERDTFLGVDELLHGRPYLLLVFAVLSDHRSP